MLTALRAGSLQKENSLVSAAHCSLNDELNSLVLFNTCFTVEMIHLSNKMCKLKFKTFLK